MCRAESYKGHQLVLEALDQLERRHVLPPGCRWDVVGDGDLRADLEALTRQLGLAARVRFLGTLGDRDLEQAFRRCSVFVMPSAFSIDADGRACGEGFGIVYLEAAMAGRPSIACWEGGQTDLIIDGESGWLIPPDSAALAALLQRLIADREQLVRCGIRARERALRDFSAEGFRRSLEAALRT
jgi:glycosyltransferase involved in cell wall biosynthesis